MSIPAIILSVGRLIGAVAVVLGMVALLTGDHDRRFSL